MPLSSTTHVDDLAGRELGDYRVLTRLGAGGMAEVYLAEQRSLGRQIALKVLKRTLVQNAAYVERFKREARAAASLIHANIVQIFEVGQADGVHFIAQEYVPGKNLAQLLARETALSPRLVLDVLRQVGSALAKAAEAGIVHRDIKPENILLSPAGEVKVADFGLARFESPETHSITQAGVTMGTPLYMSPEQIEGRPVDSRSDIYSLGVTAYHLLAGVPPHLGDTALAIAVQHLNAPPRPLADIRADVPAGLARIVHRMIAKRPDERYQHPSELLAELRQLAAEAARLGWAEGPELWPADWQTPILRSASAAELGRLMRLSSVVERPPRSWRRAAIVGAAVAAGMLLGAATLRRAPLGDPEQTVRVAKLDDAWAQLAHANLAPSEAAWLAVGEHFPDADPLIKDLATEGLIRYHLFLSRKFRQALAVLEAWPEPPHADASDARRRTFRLASLVIAHQQLGHNEEARRAASQLGDGRDQLQRSDPQLAALLAKALDLLNTAL